MRTLLLAAIVFVALTGVGCSSSSTVTARPSAKPTPEPASTVTDPSAEVAATATVVTPIVDPAPPAATGNAAAKRDLIQVTVPRPNASVSSPVSVVGQARGNWFFEASFPVKLVDAGGKTLGTGIAQTTDEWMTTSFVTFTATVSYTAMAPGSGTLVLMRSNPSGDPSRDEELNVPVEYASSVAE